MTTEERLTYKSSWGDYGCNKTFENDWEESNAFRNRLGVYEDVSIEHDVAKDGKPKENGFYFVSVLNHATATTFATIDYYVADLQEFSIEDSMFKVVAWAGTLDKINPFNKKEG